MPAVWLGGTPHSRFLEVCPPPYLFLPVGLSEEAEKAPSSFSSSTRASSRSGGGSWEPAIPTRGGQRAGSAQVCGYVCGQVPVL